MTTWKTITIGNKSAEQYRREIKASGAEIGSYANELLSKMPVSDKVQSLNLVKISVKDLGFTETTSLKDIYKRAKEQGLDLCPAEVGPALRLAYLDQPEGEYLWIGMEPIAGSDGDLSVFCVGRDGGGRWLGDSIGNPGDLWDPEGEFVFRKSDSREPGSSDTRALGDLDTLDPMERIAIALERLADKFAPKKGKELK